MSMFEVAMNIAMIKKYKDRIGEKPPKGMCLCILEDGCLGLDLDHMEKKEATYINLKLIHRGDVGDQWGCSCTGNFIRS